MADVAETAELPAETNQRLEFGGTERNLVPGFAMLLAGILAFFMNMTDVFFAEATAWVIIIWGALLIFVGLADQLKRFEVTEDALIIHDDMRLWSRNIEWDWSRITRMDIVTHSKDTRLSDAEMRVYATVEGELTVLREDRSFDPELARLVIERAGLNPAGANVPADLTALPLRPAAVYTWQ